MKSQFANRLYPFGLFIFLITSIQAQDTYVRNESADVRSYIFNLELNDDNNEIKAKQKFGSTLQRRHNLLVWI